MSDAANLLKDRCEDCGKHFVAAHMTAAFAAAEAALHDGEVAVGCVLVHSNTSTVVAHGHNRTNRDRHALGHAEFDAVECLRNARNGDLKDLSEYELYVTVEPCIMCAAMLQQNRIGHVFYGCSNPRFGGNGGVLRVHQSGRGEYCSSGGWEADRAVLMLQQFYSQENALAPDHKRRRKEMEGA